MLRQALKTSLVGTIPLRYRRQMHACIWVLLVCLATRIIYRVLIFFPFSDTIAIDLRCFNGIQD
jgi:hypothetical protein